jgi:hypothetical protein
MIVINPTYAVFGVLLLGIVVFFLYKYFYPKSNSLPEEATETFNSEEQSQPQPVPESFENEESSSSESFETTDSEVASSAESYTSEEHGNKVDIVSENDSSDSE